jgi:hypothetical protein
MGSGKKGSSAGGNGDKKKELHRLGGDGEATKSKTHRRKERERKKNSREHGVGPSDGDSQRRHLRGSEAREEANDGVPPFGRSAVASDSRRPAIFGEHSFHAAGTSESPGTLIVRHESDVFGNVDEAKSGKPIADTAGGNNDRVGAPRGNVALSESTIFARAEDCDGKVLSAAGSTAAGKERRDWSPQACGKDVVQTTQRNGVGRNRGILETRTNITRRGRGTTVGTLSGTVHGTGTPGIRKRQYAGEANTHGDGVGESSALQHLYNLMWSLNPEERRVFLETHTLVRELQSGCREEDIPPGGIGNDNVQQTKDAHASGASDGYILPATTAAHVDDPEKFPAVGKPSPVRGEDGDDGLDSNRDSGREDVVLDGGGVLAEGSRDEAADMTAGFKRKERRNAAEPRTTTARVDKGKAVAAEEEDARDGAVMRANEKLIKKLRRELKAAEEGIEGCAVGARDSGRVSDHSGIGNTGKQNGAICKKRRRSAAAAILVEKADPLGPEWAAVRDVPPVEVNRLGEPTGAFWDHMKPYVFDRGAYTFPWDINWNRQSPKLKARFIFRLRKLYPGPWEAKGVLNLLGNNLREKRNRLKRRFRIYSNAKAVTRPKGCTLQSWEQIYRDLRDPKKKKKSDLCKMRADERLATGSPFSHRTGRGGYRGIVGRFVSVTSGICSTEC